MTVKAIDGVDPSVAVGIEGHPNEAYLAPDVCPYERFSNTPAANDLARCLSAPVWLVFDPPGARVGTSITAYTDRPVAAPVTGSAIELVRSSIVADVVPQDRSGAVQVATVPAGPAGTKIEFDIPDVDEGIYEAVVTCNNCAASFGKTTFPSGSLVAFKKKSSNSPDHHDRRDRALRRALRRVDRDVEEGLPVPQGQARRLDGSERLERSFGQQLPEGGVLTGLADRDQRVARWITSSGWAPGDRLRLAQDRDHGDPGLRAEAALGERLPIDGLASGTGIHSIEELAERHLEVLDDLRPLVGAADHRAELARLVVVEADHRARLVVVALPEEVELALAVVVQDHRESAAAVESEA